MGNLPIGQGLAVTPMQMMAGYAAIANGGMLRPPQLIKRVGDEEVHEPKGHRVIDRRASRPRCGKCSRACWRPAVPPRRSACPATRWPARPEPPQVAENGTYSETKYVASFIGFAPAQDPQLLAAVIVDQPQGEIYGGSVAAPAFGQIAGFALPYLGVPQE